MSPSFVATMPIAFAASMTEPPPSAMMKSHFSSRTVFETAMTVVESVRNAARFEHRLHAPERADALDRRAVRREKERLRARKRFRSKRVESAGTEDKFHGRRMRELHEGSPRVWCRMEKDEPVGGSSFRHDEALGRARSAGRSFIVDRPRRGERHAFGKALLLTGG